MITLVSHFHPVLNRFSAACTPFLLQPPGWCQNAAQTASNVRSQTSLISSLLMNCAATSMVSIVGQLLQQCCHDLAVWPEDHICTLMEETKQMQSGRFVKSFLDIIEHFCP